VRYKVHPSWAWLGIAVVNEHRFAADSQAGLNISPPVAYDKTPTEIDTEIPRSGQEQAGLRLAAVTTIRIIVVADPNVIEPNTAAQEVVNLLDAPTGQAPTGHFRLVRDDNQKKAVTS